MGDETSTLAGAGEAGSGLAGGGGGAEGAGAGGVDGDAAGALAGREERIVLISGSRAGGMGVLG